jgi:alpha-N-arabinofuranosidase
LRGTKAKSITGRLLTAAAMNTHNTFDEPEDVKPVIFKAAKLENNNIFATLPSKSVVILKIE